MFLYDDKWDARQSIILYHFVPKAITCPERPAVEDAIIVSATDDRNVGAVIKYQCNDSFVVHQDNSPLNELQELNKTCEVDQDGWTGKWTGNYSCRSKCAV